MKKIKMMKLSSTIALLLILIIGIALPALNNIIRAQTTPNTSYYTYIYVSPNPIGVGQSANVGWGFTMPTIDPYYYKGWMLTITSPSGQNQTLGPFNSDATGGIGTSFTPSSIGTYLFQVYYPGGNVTYDPIDGYTAINAYVPPAYTVQVSLNVTQTPLGYPSISALPTSYWQYPVYGDNELWYSISGNWLMSGYDTGRSRTGSVSGVYDPDTLAPSTAHILWTQPWMFGGVASYQTPSTGALTKSGGASVQTYYTGSNYLEEGTPPIIINGYLYYNQVNAPAYGFYCINLYNGQTVWFQNQTFLSATGSIVGGTTAQLSEGQLLLDDGENQNGIMPYLYATGGTTWARYDAYTGNLLNTVTGAIGYSETLGNEAMMFGPDGELLVYYFEQANPHSYTATLALWNSTLCGLTGTYSQAQTLNIPWKNGIQWNVTVPACPEEGVDIGACTWDPKNPTEIIVTNQTNGNPVVAGAFEDIAYSTTTGQELWSAARNTVPGSTWEAVLFSSRAMGDGIYTIFRKETAQLYAYSATTGAQLWVSDPRPGNLGTFCSGEVIANGLIYMAGYDGYVIAYNVTTGATVWSYYDGSTNPSGLETPYGQYPFYGAMVVAGGVVFAGNQEHTEQSPLFVGEGIYAINATTGKLIWQIKGQFKEESLAGGVMVAPNQVDGQNYAFGKGPSKTTITAPDAGVTTGAPIAITGTVMDVSAGAKQQAVAANFPNGLPCVSDSSMTDFMQSVYEQQPMTTNITGVPVTISVLDSNGNYRTIGRTTTSAMGDYGLTWTPDIQGNFTVYATFAGSGGYYGSSASTYFCASPTAATPAPTSSPLSLASTQNDIMYVGIAIIIVIVIIGAVLAMLMLRKRP